jgi:iron complex outermembrane receptor protein
MQPLNALISLNHHLGNWNSTAELRLVNDKSVTNPLQNEQTTPGFAIVNWRTSYRLENVTVAVGIDNLFNKQYYDPNGGAYVSYWRATNTSAAMGALPASGRSYNAGMTVTF